MDIPTVTYPNYRPYSNVQPFTVRDGATYLMTLEALRVWIRDVLVPHIDSEIEGLTASWESSVSAVISEATVLADNSRLSAEASELSRLAAEVARDMAEFYAAQAEETQDAAVSTLIKNANSDTRKALNDLYASITAFNEMLEIIQNGRLSESTIDARFGEKAELSYVESSLLSVRSDIDSLTEGQETLVNTVESGRLAQQFLDNRHGRVDIPVHAVFIGSSNATPGTWVEDFSERMGYLYHNYSVGGGGFTAQGELRFDAQVAVAVADNSYSKDLVKYFFICDAGNDIRANNNVQQRAATVFATIASNYPNAQIVVLPAVWGNATMNNNTTAISSISMRCQEMLNAALDYNVNFVWGSWRWLADSGNWMLPGEVHPNNAGYARIGAFMASYMRGGETEYNIGQKFIASKPAVFFDNSQWLSSRTGDLATIQGNFRLNSAVALDTELGQLEYGLWPNTIITVPVTQDTGRTPEHSIVVFPNGLIRSFGAIPAGNYTFASTYRVF